MSALWLILGALLVVVVVVTVLRSRRSHDGVDSFRRQINALSPEARRPVIDQVHNAGDRVEPLIEPLIEPRSVERETETGSTAIPESSIADESHESDQDGPHGT